ncbi:BON domain-containing protein [Herbaspirillum sp. HC18]|nr:BON domain-containing protein [Herbaspirillum sp. HC18]
MILTLAILHGAAHADDGPLLKNWFNDPFFQASDGMRNCPQPRGPLLTETEMKAEAHSRVERGTSCWMAGTCKEPNAYLYDASIAQAIRERLPKQEGDSLWITVRRRWVWVEGCVTDMRHAADWEAAMKAVPDVERVLVNVMQGTEGKPPYPTSR